MILRLRALALLAGTFFITPTTSTASSPLVPYQVPLGPSLSNGGASTQTCTTLLTLLGPSKLLLPSSCPSSAYMEAATRSWDNFNTQQRPACVILAQEAEDVKVGMGVVFRDKVRYAIQSGGHSLTAGWNNVQNGVLFNLSKMKNISYDASKGSITVQPGIRWGEAMTALQADGVAPLGGRVGDVGTGLLLGGGLNYLSAAHGFSVDALRSADVILVNGTMVTATGDNEYSDLFRALKGGANRFGIVVKYEVDAVPVGRSGGDGDEGEKMFFGGTLSYDESMIPQLLQAVQEYVQTVDNPNAGLLSALSLAPDGTSVNPTIIVYRGSSLPPNLFDSFLAIPTITPPSLGPLSYEEAMALLGSGKSTGEGCLWGATALGSSTSPGSDSTSGSLSDYQNLYAQWKTYVQNMQNDYQGQSGLLIFTPVQKSQIDIGRGRGGNLIFADADAAGLTGSGAENYNAVVAGVAFPQNVTSLGENVLERHRAFVNSMPQTRGLPLYVNECDASQEVFATYGRYEEMKRTYRKYDPTRFNVQFTDGPLGL